MLGPTLGRHVTLQVANIQSPPVDSILAMPRQAMAQAPDVGLAHPATGAIRRPASFPFPLV